MPEVTAKTRPMPASVLTAMFTYRTAGEPVALEDRASMTAATTSNKG
jgi:hypothetical protein